MDSVRAERALGWIRERRRGHSLDPVCYLDGDLFALERERLFRRSWLVVGHESIVPDAGCVSPRELADAPLVVVRDRERTLRVFHNSCRHRGSIVCESEGRRETLVRPYHQWTYNLQGQLLAARTVASTSETRLATCATRSIAGLLLVAVDRAPSEEADEIVRAIAPVLEWYRFHELREAKTVRYSAAANWKLVMENFDECYHCWPGHPEYSQLMAHAKPEAAGDEKGIARFEALRDAFRQRLRARGCPADASPPQVDRPFWLGHLPLLEGFSTQSMDGQLVAPPIHEDLNGIISIRIGFLAHLLLSPDHAVLFRFHPRAANATDMELTWLVRDEAEVDVDKLTALWRVTTEQDCRFVELQQRGLSSPAARVGVYVDAEEYCEHFLERYARQMLP